MAAAQPKGGAWRNNKTTPDGTEMCFAFNKAGGCGNPGCQRAHVCQRCMGAHSQLACPTRVKASGFDTW